MSTAANRVAPVVAGFDVGKVREEFPALKQLVHGKPLVYLDNAATTQKPQLVIDAITHFYQEDCSNIHRGVHLLSERATKAYEDARLAVQEFINAADPAEVIFVRGTTEAINLVAHSYGRTHVQGWRRSLDLRDGTPLQHCALANLVRRERREASRRPDERSRRAPAG